MRIQLILVSTVLFITMTANAIEIIYKDKAGKTLTLDDIKNSSDSVNWEIRSSTSPSKEAVRLHQLGRNAGQRGAYAAANDYFEQASSLAPDWPYPIYDEAYTYLLMGNSEKAYELYQRVEVMRPRGFYTALTAVNSLQGELKGKFPKGAYIYFVSVEGVNDENRKIQMLDSLIAQAPKFAPAWKEKAALEPDIGKRLTYLEKGLAADPDAVTKGYLLINKAGIIYSRGQKTEAIQILGKLALDPQSPLDVEALAKVNLRMLLGK
jgi:tetratricopeptide (TPR) repeat protein